MEILKVNKKEYDKMKFGCRHCDSKFIAEPNEYKFDEYAEFMITTCPVCGKPCREENPITYYSGC